MEIEKQMETSINTALFVSRQLKARNIKLLTTRNFVEKIDRDQYKLNNLWTKILPTS